MRKITKEYTIYKYDELSENSQERAIYDYIEELLNFVDFATLNKNNNLYKAIKKAEDMLTPWFTNQYVWEYCQKSILENLKKGEYYEDGSVYCG